MSLLIVPTTTNLTTDTHLHKQPEISLSVPPTTRRRRRKNKKNYVFNEAASKDYVCTNQGTKPGLFLIISEFRPLPTTNDN